MKLISRSRKLGLVLFIIPLLVINSILIFSQSFEWRGEPTRGHYYKDIKIYNAVDALRSKQDVEKIGYAIPYIDGATSISRLGRVYPNWLVFKPSMIFTGFLLCYFWRNQKKIFMNFDIDQKQINKFYNFGLICGITFIIHIIFLGIKFDNNLYKFLIRLNLACCVLFSILAKFYFVKCVKKLSETLLELKNIFFKFQYFLAHILLITLILSIFLLFFENSKTLILIIEWNYFFAIFLFYLLYNLSWKKITI